jgi:hypothetical protein
MAGEMEIQAFGFPRFVDCSKTKRVLDSGQERMKSDGPLLMESRGASKPGACPQQRQINRHFANDHQGFIASNMFSPGLCRK